MSVDGDPRAPVVPFHRAVQREGDAVDAGDASDPFRQRTVDRFQALGRDVPQRDVERRDVPVGCLKAEVLGLQVVQASREQAGARDEDERQGDLQRNEPAPEPRVAVARDAPRAAHRVDRIRSRRRERRHDPEHDAGRDRHGRREREHGRRRRRVDRDVAHAAERHRHDRARALIRHDQAGEPARAREYDAFDHRFGDQPSTRRARGVHCGHDGHPAGQHGHRLAEPFLWLRKPGA